MLLVSACKRSDNNEECVDPAASAGAKATVDSKASASKSTPVNLNEKDMMWCRSCVVGPAGFMSCQTIRQSDAAETTAALRDRARVAACVDSGFTKDHCPASNVVTTACKGDPPPADKTAAAKAMLDALKTSGPVVVTKDGKTLENAMYQKPSGPGEPPPSDSDASTSKDKPASTEKKSSSGAPPVI
jgi:hypothetical protein